jgi:hypothetical protein
MEKHNKEVDQKIDYYNAETQRIRALSDHEVDANQMEMDAIKTIIEGSKVVDEHDIKRDELDRRDSQHSSTLAAKQAQASSKAKSQSASANG